MECSNLIGCECSDDAMKKTSIMEKDEIVFFPVVRINKLFYGGGKVAENLGTVGRYV
jgi:hypothetical protein